MNNMQRNRNAINMLKSFIENGGKGTDKGNTYIIGFRFKDDTDIISNRGTFYLVGKYQRLRNVKAVENRDKVYIGDEYIFVVSGLKLREFGTTYNDLKEMVENTISECYSGPVEKTIGMYDGLSGFTEYKSYLDAGRLSELNSYRFFYSLFDGLIGEKFKVVLHSKVYKSLKDRSFIPIVVYDGNENEFEYTWSRAGYKTTGRSRSKNYVYNSDCMSSISSALIVLPLNYWGAVDLSSIKSIDDEYTMEIWEP